MKNDKKIMMKILNNFITLSSDDINAIDLVKLDKEEDYFLFPKSILVNDKIKKFDFDSATRWELNDLLDEALGAIKDVNDDYRISCLYQIEKLIMENYDNPLINHCANHSLFKIIDKIELDSTLGIYNEYQYVSTFVNFVLDKYDSKELSVKKEEELLKEASKNVNCLTDLMSDKEKEKVIKYRFLSILLGINHRSFFEYVDAKTSQRHNILKHIKAYDNERILEIQNDDIVNFPSMIVEFSIFKDVYNELSNYRKYQRMLIYKGKLNVLKEKAYYQGLLKETIEELATNVNSLVKFLKNSYINRCFSKLHEFLNAIECEEINVEIENANEQINKELSYIYHKEFKRYSN